MSSSLLNFIADKKPLFNMDYAILSAPVRHTFMMGAVWYVAKTILKNQPIHILEVGSWLGASALSFAQGLDENHAGIGTITCIDAWQPFLTKETSGKDVYQVMDHALATDTAYQIFLHNMQCISPTIVTQHLRGKSHTLLSMLRENYFDIIFIDGDHAYSGVKEDIRNSLPLIKEGGLICGDDLNLQLHQVDKALTLQNAERDLITDKATNRPYHPGVTLAVAEQLGEVSAWGGFWAMQKVGNGWQKICLKEMPISFPHHFPESALAKARAHLADIVI